METKMYLGDGLYVNVQAEHEIIITSENGIEVFDTIVLEYDMIQKMKDFVDRVLSEDNKKWDIT